MYRVNGIHFAVFDPCFKDSCLLPKPVPVVLIEIFIQANTVTNNFHGKNMRG